MMIHPLTPRCPLPERMNNPFLYDPHPLCIQAAKEVQAYISSVSLWQDELAQGKMFGVLVVEEKDGNIGYLAAYSGLLANRNDWDFFVPPIFDLQQPDGYFKQEEACITAINKQVDEVTQSEAFKSAKANLAIARHNAHEAITHYREEMEEAKLRRDAIRCQWQQDSIPVNLAERLIHESQFMKAELRRIKRHHAQLISNAEAAVKQLETTLHTLQEERRKRSDALQKWLFDQFRILNAKGEEKSLTQIFSDAISSTPPAGAGECCAPKLLQAAFKYQLRPLCMAEFWWGASPDGEVRQQGNYYPACKGKCLPILQFMLQGMEIPTVDTLASNNLQPTILYEDSDIVVVDKPAGMLTVPGKETCHSVERFLMRQYPKAEHPIIVHRLDMDTSGLLVAALNKKSYVNLQRQFLVHSVEKTYMALLDGHLPPSLPREGCISLPLAPDWNDRPRQKVDFEKGKKAQTHYQVTDESGLHTHILLFPATGRTHQLRVHCAHKDGLATPILGDRLYGRNGGRLCLHSCRIVFTHPATGERMTFSSDADFQSRCK